MVKHGDDLYDEVKKFMQNFSVNKSKLWRSSFDCKRTRKENNAYLKQRKNFKVILTRKEKRIKGQARIYEFKHNIMNANTNVTY